MKGLALILAVTYFVGCYSAGQWLYKRDQMSWRNFLCGAFWPVCIAYYEVPAWFERNAVPKSPSP